jgi:hypothetical protein
LLCWDSLSIVLGVTGTFFLAKNLRKNFTFSGGLISFVSAALLFYIITNTVSFFTETSLYTRNFHGFMKAQWFGPEGYLPTWIFLRNSVAANLLFGTLFLLAQKPILFVRSNQIISKA